MQFGMPEDGTVVSCELLVVGQRIDFDGDFCREIGTVFFLLKENLDDRDFFVATLRDLDMRKHQFQLCM